MKTAILKPATLPAENMQNAVVHTIHLIVNGNTHRPDLASSAATATGGIQISEALLPQIRTVATLIAAMRHDFSDRSPNVFTEEADWFAARIIVLNVKRFHLDVSLLPMLKLANRRAAAFAAARNLPFAPADIRMSLHAGRPAQLLIAETGHTVADCGGMVANSAALKKQLADF